MDNIDNDEEGLIFNLGSDDSALVVRSDGSVELISKEFEKKGDGEYLGDIEDLNRTFSLVLALAASLENEQLYHQIFQNLNVILMKQWDRLPADKKKEIADIRKIRHDQETIEDKKKRLDSFRDRMNDYKDNFLDADRRRMQEELERAREHFERGEFPGDSYGPERPRRKKKKVNPLIKLKNINWNPRDESLTAHFKDYRVDAPPDEEN
jgi:hypothetical protein|tara:strand:- start:363 stop:989 length:627 start_codon:yes stop_codon:yes gene_type:complete